MRTRREFLKNSVGFGAGMLSIPALFSAGCAKAGPKAELGLQIYSLRNQLKEDFPGTLKQIAAIGYKNIEAYGLGNDGLYLKQVKPADYKKMCNDLGMNLVSTHAGYSDAEGAKPFIDGALESGLKHLVVPYLSDKIRQSADDYKKIAETFNKVGEMCNAAGLEFGYHNHAFEFEKVDGQVGMEILIENTDADKVSFELDLYWITKGGFDAVEFVNKYTGRFSCFHIKDGTKEMEMTTIGKGVIDFGSMIAANKKYLKYYFVEDERKETPVENVTAAYQYLSNAKFV